MVFTMQPLFEAGTPALPSSGRDVMWIIIDRSTSSKCPSRSSSGLPPRNSSLPARACATRHSMSPYSSAGTRKAGWRLEAERAERVLHQPRRLHFLEAELRMLSNLLPDSNDVLAPPVDGRVHALLQLGLRHERLRSSLVSRAIGRSARA